MSDDRTNHFLTTEQIDKLKAVITDTQSSTNDGAHTFTVFIMALWKELLGQDCFDTGAKIEVTKHAIQKDVSMELLQHLVSTAGEAHRAHVGMNYINIGPSSW